MDALLCVFVWVFCLVNHFYEFSSSLLQLEWNSRPTNQTKKKIHCHSFNVSITDKWWYESFIKTVIQMIFDDCVHDFIVSWKISQKKANRKSMSVSLNEINCFTCFSQFSLYAQVQRLCHILEWFTVRFFLSNLIRSYWIRYFSTLWNAIVAFSIVMCMLRNCVS